MNVGNWLSVFILSLLIISAVGYSANRVLRRGNGLWNVISLAFAGLICATMFATLSAYTPTVTTAVRAAAAQTFTCVGTPPLVRAGDEVAVTGVAPANSAIALVQGAETLATTTADASGAFAATITLSTSGLQTVNCQAKADGQTNTITLSFLVIGQAAAPTPAPTNTPAPTATDTAEPTATDTPVPTVAPPVVDMASIPEQLLPGDTFRLRGTADGGARVRVTINKRVVAGAVTGPQGSWRTTVGFAKSGEYTLTVQLVQDDAVVAETEPIFLTVLEPTPTATNTPEPTATNTPEPTDTNTPEPTATDTPEPTDTNTPEPTNTDTPEPTATNTPEPTNTDTPEPTATNTPEPTNTNTPEPTATDTPTAAPPVVDTASIPDQLLPGNTFRLRGTAAGGARVQVSINNRVVAGAVAGPQGSWRTTVGFAKSGEYTLTVQLLQDNAVVAQTEPIFLTVLEPTPTPEPTATATDTPEPTATNTPEPTATNTPEPTATVTNTPEPTATNTPEPTATPIPTPTNTPEPTATDTPEPTATNTPEPTNTNTPEPTATNTPTAAPPVVDTASIPDQLLPGDTFRLRGTADGGARVQVSINKRVVAGAVAGPQGSWRTTVGFAKSGEYTLTVQLLQDNAVVAQTEPIFLTVLEPTPTPAPTATATDTPEPTATNTPEPTATATDTPEPTATNTPEPTATDTPEPTATNTVAPTATNTPEPTATNTPEPTATDTPEPTATNTVEPTATETPTAAAPVVDMASIPDQLLPGDTFRLRGTAAGGARVQVAVNNRVVAGAVAGPQGSWRTTVGFAKSGTYTLTVQVLQNDVVAAETEPIFLTVLEPTPTTEPTPTAVLEPTATAAAPVQSSPSITSSAPITESQPITGTGNAPGALPGTGSDFSGGVPWVVLILLLGAAVTLGMGRLSNKPTA